MKSEDYKKLKRQIEDQYKQAIALAEKQRTEGLAAIETVWEMLHTPRKKQSINISIQEQAKLANDQSSLVSKTVYGDLLNTVKKALTFVPETFTCNQVIETMKQVSGNTFNYSSVSNRLKRMAQENVIEIIKQGHGKLPSLYRRKNNQVIEKETEL
jgi:hypothetical protein